MGNIWTIKLIKNEFIELIKNDNFIIFKLGKHKFKDYLTKDFSIDIERQLELNKDNDFRTKGKEIKFLKEKDFISIKNINGTYSLVKLNSNPFLVEEGIKVEIDKIRELDGELDIPTALRIDDRTKNTKLKKFETKELESFNKILEKILDKDENVYKENIDYFLDSNRQATPASKGYLEQSIIALFYTFFNRNYKNIEQIKIEGRLEDIEVKYRTGKKDYIQVKVAEFPQEERNFNSSRFLEGLEGLTLTYKKVIKYGIELNKLIYATNVYEHPVKRISNQIKEGFIVNDFTAFNELLPSEKEELQKKYKVLNSSQGLCNKLSILRVDPKYLTEIPEFSKEYDSLNSSLGTTDEKSIIYKDLESHFIRNSAIRELSIDIFEIAYEFLKKGQDDRSFNLNYADELENLDVMDIEEFIKGKGFSARIKVYTRYKYLIDEYIDLEKNFEKEFKKKLTNSNLKTFLDSNYHYLEKYELFSKELRMKEKSIIYKYILYTIYKHRILRKNIHEEFNLE